MTFQDMEYDDPIPLVLAAGKGLRMKGSTAKLVQPVAGRPMIARVVETLASVTSERPHVVVGAAADAVREALDTLPVRWVYQQEQLGTGHAVLQARPKLADSGRPILIQCGDTPLITADLLRRLIEQHRASGAVATVGSAVLPNPSGYGRIVRAQHGGGFLAIVEDRDCTSAQRDIDEINTGLYLVDGEALFACLDRIGSKNAQGEVYLTDVFGLLVEQGHRVQALPLEPAEEVLGINDRVQLAAAEAILRRRILENLMREGVTIIDPSMTYIDDDVDVGVDTVIEPGVHIRAGSRIGAGCRIGVGSVLTAAHLDDRVMVHPYTIIEHAAIGSDASVGPFARLRPDTKLLPESRVGNFVELKKTVLGAGAKANHLAYLGDATVGAGANIGAGTITCNYDGVNKHPTVLGDEAFVGSNSTLVAPLSIGNRAYVAAGSVINKDVAAEALALGRARQVVKEGYRERLERRMNRVGGDA